MKITNVNFISLLDRCILQLLRKLKKLKQKSNLDPFLDTQKRCPVFVLLSVPIKLCFSSSVPYWVATCPSGQLVRSKLWSLSSLQLPSVQCFNHSREHFLQNRVKYLCHSSLLLSLYPDTTISCLIHSNGFLLVYFYLIPICLPPIVQHDSWKC